MTDKQILNYAYENAIMFSKEENKIGSAILDQKGKVTYGSNCDGIDPVINVIDKVSGRKQNKINFLESKLYVTDNIDLSNRGVLRRIGLKYNFKEIIFCIRNNDEKFKELIYDKLVKEGISSKITIYFRNLVIDENNFSKWWTDEFYDKAYDIVKDRKFPVTIPGYNRPELPTLKNLRVLDYTEECNWPFIIIVRDSQREMYEEATKQYKYVTIKSFPDMLINNAGAVRRTTQKWLNSIGVKATFQMDDDVSYLGYSYASRKEDGYPKSQYRRPKTQPFSSAKVLAMWQVAMEKAMASDNVLISCGQQIAFSWKEDYCMRNRSCRLMRGPMTQVVCFNIESLCKEQIFHNNNANVGFDDIDFTLRVIESGNKTCCFTWLVYGCEALGGGNGDQVSEDKLKARFKENQEKLKVLHKDKPYVSFRPKRDLDQVCISWTRARDYYSNLKNVDRNQFVNHTEFDIWRNGKLLDEAKSYSYEKMTEETLI